MDEIEEKVEEVQKNVKKESKGLIWEIWSWTYSIAIAVAVVLLIKNLLFSTTIVKKESMIPTLQENNMLVIDRLSQIRKIPLERGDIVIIEAPDGVTGEEKNLAYYSENDVLTTITKWFGKKLYVKRAIAVEGDHIRIESDAVYINGNKIDEPYVNPKNSYNGAGFEMVVPEGYVFCMGDNRGSSYDSRDFGAVPVEKVEGRIIFRFFPFDQMGKVE